MTAAGAFTLGQEQREQHLVPALTELTNHHRLRCEAYARILAALDLPPRRLVTTADVPWLPVRIFKDHVIRSIDADEVFKVMLSSGTTGAARSKIYLDRRAAADQTRFLARTLGTLLGPQRLPMLLVDSQTLVGDRASFSARSAGVVGMAALGKRHAYVLDREGRPDAAAVERFLAEHAHQPFVIFGFTYMVWQHLLPIASSAGLDLSNGYLFHSGGWKRLQEIAVGDAVFRQTFAERTGLTKISNYYGMVEQLGTVFVQHPSGGDLYCPDFADVVIRDPKTLEVLPDGEVGIIEVLSTVPRSYPGHALLTEDLGVIRGTDDGLWPGKRFSVRGRIARSEARGCSDTVAL